MNCSYPPFRAVILLVCFALLVGTALPQQPPSPSEPRELTASPDRERIIYIPFSNLDGAFEKPDSSVLLPYAEYQKLLKSWKEAQAGAAGPGAAVTSADYVIRVEEGAARISARLHVQVLNPGWTEVPLRYGEAAVGSLKAPDKVLLRGAGAGQYSLLFPGAGDFDVELELSAAVRQSPDGNDIGFDVPPVALTTVDVTVPQAAQKIEIQPVVVATPVPDAGPNVTRVKASVGAARQIIVRWRPEASLQPEMNLLTSVTSQLLVNLGDGLAHTDAWFTYEILRGELDTVRLALPKTARVLDVDAAGRVRSWKSIEQGENQILTLELLSPVKDRLVVEVHTESPLGDGPFDVAGMEENGRARGIHPMDVVRETGQIAVRHAADLALSVVEQQGVVRIEAAEVAPKLTGSNALTFKYYSPALRLRLSANPVTPRLSVRHDAQLVFKDEELQLTHDLAFRIERAGVFELRFQVPENVIIDDVRGEHVKDFRIETGTRQLTVALRERTVEDLQLAITAHMPLPPAGAAAFPLPVLEPLGVERELGSLTVFARESLEVRTDPAGVSGAQPQPVSRGMRLNDAVLASAWTFTRRPVVVPVRTERKPTRLSATIGTRINVQPELIGVESSVDFLVEYAGINMFRIEVPEAISGQVRIELSPGDTTSVPIQQRSPGTPTNGRVVWTVTTQREALGHQKFLVTYDLPPAVAPSSGPAAAANSPSAETTTSVFLPRPLAQAAQGDATPALAQLQGEVTFLKDQALAIRTSPAAGTMEQIDVRELTLVRRDGLLAYRYFRDDAAPLSIDVTQSRFEIQEVVATVVPKGLVEIVLGEDNAATYRCRMQVKSTQRQRLLAWLPVNLEVLGAFVGDREVKLEKADVAKVSSLGENFAPFWVNVARPESSETPFLLTFQFLWTVNPALRDSTAMRGELELPLPVLGETGTGVVQEMKVVVWTPEHYELVGDPHGFNWAEPRKFIPFTDPHPHPSAASGLDEWISLGSVSTSRGGQLPTTGRVPYVYTNLGGQPRISVVWWKRLPMTLVFSVALFLIGWILLSTTWENRLSFLLLLAFAATLYGVFDRGALWHALAAMRWGLLALLGLWVIRGVTRGLSRQVSPAPPPPPAAPPAPQPV